MTALCGMAQNFWQLAIARVGVGIGEAGCSPPAHSLIADFYPREKRATALGIYALGIPFGIMFGLFIGGWMNEAFGWRKAFFVVGIPGLLLALLVRFTLPEPPRGMSEKSTRSGANPTVMETFRFLLRSRSFIHIAIGGALAAFVGYGVISWFPAFLIRTHGMGTGEIGLWFGLIMGIAGGAGMFSGGYLADRFGARDTRWYLWTSAVLILVTLPFGAVAYFLSNPYWAMVLFIPPVFASNSWQATSFAQTQSLVQLRMRSMASAILLFVANIIGLGAGPWAVGFLSDVLAPQFGADSLRWSLFIFGGVNIWTAWHYYLAGKYLKADLAAADQVTTPV